MSEREPTGRDKAQHTILTKLIFGDDSAPDTIDLDEQPDPIKAFVHRCQVLAALGKSSDASCILDLSVPEGDVDDDSGPLYRSPRIVRGVSSALRKSDGKAFIQLLAKIREVFDGHPEEMHEAIEIATRMRDDARAEAIALAAR